MDTLMIKIQPDKKDFFLALLKELAFVEVAETFTEEEQKYIKAVQESEDDIQKGDIIPHEALKKEIHTWRK